MDNAHYWNVSGNLLPPPSKPLERQIACPTPMTVLTDVKGNVVLNEQNTSGDKKYAYPLIDRVGLAHRHPYESIGNVGHPVPVGVHNPEFVVPQCFTEYKGLYIVGTHARQ